MSHKDTQEAYPSSWSPRATRILQIAVIVMGVLIVVGFIVVVVTVFSRMASNDPADAPAVMVSGPEIRALMGPDAEIVATETDSGRLAVVLRTPDGPRIVVVDMRSGEIISVIGGS